MRLWTVHKSRFAAMTGRMLHVYVCKHIYVWQSAHVQKHVHVHTHIYYYFFFILFFYFFYMQPLHVLPIMWDKLAQVLMAFNNWIQLKIIISNVWKTPSVVNNSEYLEKHHPECIITWHEGVKSYHSCEQ